MRFDGFSSLCKWCSDARQRLIDLQRSEDARRQGLGSSGRKGGPVQHPAMTNVEQKTYREIEARRRAPVAPRPHRRSW
jgi:hypothetical protein